MTRAELRRRILRQLHDDPDAPVFWTRAEIDGYLEEAQEVLAEEAEGLHRATNIVKHDGMQLITTHSIADNVMAPLRIYDNENERRLEFMSMRQLDAERHRWMETTGDRPFWWYPVSWGLFGIHPPVASGEGTFRMDYLAWPTPMLGDTSTPEWSEADQDTMVLYGVYMGLMKQWEIARATDLFTQFLQGWQDTRERQGTNRLRAGRLVRRARR